MATGQAPTPSRGPTRTEADFAAHIAQTMALDPTANWTWGVDQLNPHQSETPVKLVVAYCELTADLSVRGKSGILKSLATRRAFLMGPTHRIRFVYTPQHSSWLKQIE